MCWLFKFAWSEVQMGMPPRLATAAGNLQLISRFLEVDTLLRPTFNPRLLRGASALRHPILSYLLTGLHHRRTHTITGRCGRGSTYLGEASIEIYEALD